MAFLKEIDKKRIRARLNNIYRLKKMSLLRTDLTFFIFFLPFILWGLIFILFKEFYFLFILIFNRFITFTPMLINGFRVSRTYKNIICSIVYFTLWVVACFCFKNIYCSINDSVYDFSGLISDFLSDFLTNLVSKSSLDFERQVFYIKVFQSNELRGEICFYGAYLTLVLHTVWRIRESRQLLEFYEFGFDKEDIVEAMIDEKLYKSMKESMIWKKQYNYENNENTSVKPIKLSKKLMDELCDDD